MRSNALQPIVAILAALSVVLPSYASDKSGLERSKAAELRNSAKWDSMGAKLENQNPKLLSDLKQYKVGARDLTKSLGEQANDLVFIPTTPCRAVETRDIGGPFAPNEKRGYDLAGSASTVDFTDQVTGGLSTPCSATSLNSDIAGSVPAAALVAISVLSPTVQGYANVWASGGTEPVVATMLFSNDTFNSSFAVVPFCQSGGNFCSDDIDFKLYGATAHVAIDVYGYFARPAATPLSCIQTTDTAQSVPSSAKSGLVYSPSCSAGYTAVSMGCYWDDFGGTSTGTYITSQGLSSGATQAYCQGTNFSGAARTLNVKAVCCRVPGR